ncbi:unnamed protein product [Mycena citricolor]|uniref:Uncharacterized protein n=1 Tax=Mycena citricolor TaxID=2018698 RepID=A0AAD2H7J8_9AGAR|nr:unnamed protein product [Mycena citricolor]
MAEVNQFKWAFKTKNKQNLAFQMYSNGASANFRPVLPTCLAQPWKFG